MHLGLWAPGFWLGYMNTAQSRTESITESQYPQGIFEILGEPESLLVLSGCK